MNVTVEVEEVDLENDNGFIVDGITVTCSRCNHKVEVYGTSDASIRRGCVMLKEECPSGERNFYET